MRGLACAWLVAAAFVRSEDRPAKYHVVPGEHTQLQVKRKHDKSEYWLVQEDFAKRIVLSADADRGWVGTYTSFCIKEQRSADQEHLREEAHKAAKKAGQTKKRYDPCDAHLEASASGSTWTLTGGLHCEGKECYYQAPNGARVSKPPVFATIAYVNQGRIHGSSVRKMEVHLGFSRTTYVSVPPAKDPETGEDIMLFHAGADGSVRVEVPSIKNFILARPGDGGALEPDSRTDLLQFGKSAAEDLFNLDLFEEVSQLQAFGIAISSLAWKLGVK